jgi:endo-1,4-beta-xylanase
MSKNKLTRRDFLKLAGSTSASLMLSACGVKATNLPASPTAITVATPLIPTQTAFPTNTPIPTLAGIPISVPDPSFTNPELFDLQKSNAPIPQFVNGMSLAGIQITPEDVTKYLQYQVLKNVDGKEFVVGYFALDSGSVPILIASEDNSKWVWKEAMLKNLAEPLNFLIGTGVGGFGFAEYYHQIVEIQTRGDFNLALLWVGNKWRSNGEPPPKPTQYEDTDSDVKIAQRADMAGYGHLLLWGPEAPKWVRTGEYTRDEVITLMKDSIRSTMSRYKGKIKYWNVVNEAYARGTAGSNDFFLEKIGAEYVEIAFQTARETDSSAILIYNDFDNHIINGQRTSHTKKIIGDLKSKGLVDIVGLETILFYPDIPTKQQLIDGIQNYEIPVMITEFNVNMASFNGTDDEKYFTQAKIYQDAIEAALESKNCKQFIMWNVSDAANCWQTQTSLVRASPKNDPSPFNRQFQPKPAYYASRMAFYNYWTFLQ